MKKLRNMKKNNKGFSLVELIVVIAIMAVLVAVLGSAILGYIDDANYSKDMQALDSIKTAMTRFVAEPDAEYDDNITYELADLIEADGGDVISDTLAETFETDGTFNASSDAFEGITTEDVLVRIVDGAVSIRVPADEDSEEEDYIVLDGDELTAADAPAAPDAE